MWLARTILELSRQVRDESDNDAVKTRCEAWLSRVRAILTGTRLGSLVRVSGGGVHVARTAVESIDQRYRRTHSIASSLHNLLGWTAQRERRHLYSFVHYSDDIYLTFVAHVACAAIGLEPTHRAQPAFQGGDWDCYINCLPPKGILRSWRSYTRFPDAFRPDLLFVRRRDGAVVIGDAKYRNDGMHASQSSRRDLMSYMNAFGVAQTIVFYPPVTPSRPTPDTNSYGGSGLVEIPVSPTPDLVDNLALHLPSVLESCAEIPPWR